MKKGLLIFLLLCGNNAWADVCYDIGEQTAENAFKLIQQQKEIYEYCSLCDNAKPIIIPVQNVVKGSPISVNNKKLDLVHTYYKNKGKFINLGVASGCIKAGEYNIAAELADLPVKQPTEIDYRQISRQQMKDIFDKCSNSAKSEKSTISEIEKQNKQINNCLIEVIKTEIKKGFDNNQQAQMFSYLEQVHKSVFNFYYGIAAESKYCSGECGIMLSIQPYAEEGKVLSDILERLIYMNNVKDGY